MKIALALVLALSGVYAAPTSQLKCNKVAGPGKLMFEDMKKPYSRTVAAFGKQHTAADGHPVLSAAHNNATSQEFQFFSCAADEQFQVTTGTGSRSGHVQALGVLRSVKHPDQCLTVHSANAAPAWGKKGKDYLGLYNCAGRGYDKGLEFQWFDYYNGRITFKGKKGDPWRPLVKVDGDGVAWMLPVQDDEKKYKGLILSQ